MSAWDAGNTVYGLSGKQWTVGNGGILSGKDTATDQYSIGSDGTAYDTGKAFGYVDTNGHIVSGTRAPAPVNTTGTSSSYTADTSSAAAQNANKAFTGETQAERMTVDPATMTVSGQMKGLLAENSPYMQMARSSALNTANDRGLLDSSMAAGAGEAAAINSSIPIASADAGTYNAAATNNMTQANNFLGQVTGLASNTANTNSQLGAQVGMANAQNATSIANTAANNTTSLALGNLDAQTKTNIANLQDATTRYGYGLDAQTKTFLGNLQADSSKYSADSSAASAMNVANTNNAGANARQVNSSAASINQSIMQQATSILGNANIPPDSKTAMLNSLNEQYTQAMKTIGIVDAVGINWDLSGG